MDGNGFATDDQRNGQLGDMFSMIGNMTHTPVRAYFENIVFYRKLNSEHGTNACVRVNANCKLWTNKVSILGGGYGITLQRNSYLYANQCSFVANAMGVNISPIANEVYITDCRFVDCGGKIGTVRLSTYAYTPSEGELGCIVLKDEEDEVISHETNYNFVQLKCVGNVFKNNKCYPICEYHNEAENCWIIDSDQYVLKNNILEGYNGTMVWDNINDANVLYFNDRQKIPTGALFQWMLDAIENGSDVDSDESSDDSDSSDCSSDSNEDYSSDSDEDSDEECSSDSDEECSSSNQ
eukprot:537185_1